MQIYAFHWHSTLEDVINHAIAHGLDNFDTQILADPEWRPHAAYTSREDAA